MITVLTMFLLQSYDKDSFDDYLKELQERKEITMGTSSAAVTRLRELQLATPSKWHENAEWRMKNKSWLRYSQRIAIMMLDKMEEMNMTQKQLSEMMGCSQQYVFKVLKGQENLSLEIISKIEGCFDIQILPQSAIFNIFRGYIPFHHIENFLQLLAKTTCLFITPYSLYLAAGNLFVNFEFIDVEIRQSSLP